MNLYSKIYLIFSIFSFFGIILFAKIINTQSSVFESNLVEKQKMMLLLPEAWGFFTKDPTEPSLGLYKLDSNNIEYVDFIDKREYWNFSFSRKARLLGREIGRVIDQLDKENWIDCPKSIKECNLATFFNVKNTAREPTFCGQYIIAMQKPIPWAWYKSSKETNIKMPSKAQKLNITCEDL